ncbi:hypothetical protein, partial [Chryseobacterium sp. SIMBA_029]|uniref:hypothetical protein n=1 Tax=Chryseobacterium sp. SIMBA_029 TaxID=3085772 RepID=UPI00397DE847
ASAPRFESAIARWKERRLAVRGAIEANAVGIVCLANQRGTKIMNGTNNQPGAGRGGRRPASMVDSQLEHLEGMIQYLTRGDAD